MTSSYPDYLTWQAFPESDINISIQSQHIDQGTTFKFTLRDGTRFQVSYDAMTNTTTLVCLTPNVEFLSKVSWDLFKPTTEQESTVMIPRKLEHGESLNLKHRHIKTQEDDEN
jgi:hypothetical protein